jgi:class 3 adenylate cyclase
MSVATAPGPTRHVATTLNAACQCVWLDQERLRRQLAARFGGGMQLLEQRPGLASGAVVFVDPQDALAMDRTARLVRAALTSPGCRQRIAEHAPSIVARAAGDSDPLLGFDFHLGGAVPQLIEVNTNPGGLLLSLEFARALTASCDCLEAPLGQLAAGHVGLSELPLRVIEHFRALWSATRGDALLATIALVDENPSAQYLYPEFILYRRLFEQAGWQVLIVDPTALEHRDDGLYADGQRIDLVYNRLTDFCLAEPRHSALRRAFETGSTVITPNPADHAQWADKRLLAWLRDERLLMEAGLDAGSRAHLLRTIPPTEIVAADAADGLWQRRKNLFFKPADGYGSKATYRGDKLTRKTFQHILDHAYVAQAVVPTSTRRVIVDEQDADLRVDVRNYCVGDATWLRAARLYRGQTTNFRTPGGGFAPVLTLR